VAGAGPWSALDPRVLSDLQSSIDQVPEAINEIRNEGRTEFEPAPGESLQLIGAQYRVPRTLVVRFDNDSIDESRQLQRALLDGGRNPADHRLIELSGSHVTPCAPDVADTPLSMSGRVSPFDVVAAAGGAVLSRETELLADRLIAFLDSESA